MSAFIVEDKTINRAVTYLLNDRDGDWTRRRLQERCALLRVDGQTLELLLFNLNVRAVEERYGEGQAKSFRPLTYRYTPEVCDRFQALKSLRCWLYQCAEGTIDQDKLYQVMEDYANDLAQRIVSGLPAYERAEWA